MKSDLNSKISFNRRIILSVVGVMVVLFAWWFTSHFKLINPFFLPNPGSVARAFANQIQEGSMVSALLITLRRFGICLSIGLVLGISSGILFGLHQWLYSTFIFWVEFLRALPVTALLPLFIAIFRTGERPLIFACSMTASLIMFINTIEAVNSIPKERKQLAELVMLNPLLKWINIYLPSMLPQISQGIRNAISVLFIVIVVSEIIMGVGNGLGYSIYRESLSFNLDYAYAYIFATGFLGWFMNSSYQLGSNRVIHWRGM